MTKKWEPAGQVRMVIPKWTFKPDTEESKMIFYSITQAVLGCATRESRELEIKVIQNRKYPSMAIALPNVPVMEYFLSPLTEGYMSGAGSSEYDNYGNLVAQGDIFMDHPRFELVSLQLYFINKILKKKVEPRESL